MRLTLWGIYQYDPTLFENVSLPEGLEKDYVIDEIMRRSGDLFTYYQVPAMLKSNITNWFLRNYDQFARMIAALLAEYNPIENYDRTEWSLHTPTEVVTTDHTGEDTNVTDHTGEDTSVTDYTGEDTREIGTTLGSTSTNSKSAFDSNTYSPYDQTTTSGGDSSTDTLTKGTTDTNTLTRGTTDTNTLTRGTTDTITNSGNHQFDSHIHGNIGVTTNQQMVEAEIELRRFDIYTDIARRFEKEFLIDIY